MKSVAHKLIIIILIGMIYSQCFSQTIIQMEEYGGVYRIPCRVNGAKMKLIFDTGADKVCLSLSMADYLYDNGYITNEDIIGSGSSTVADGSIVNHIKINIKDIEIQGIHLKNVEAVVMDGQNAPLLLGQSAIKKLGKYSISGNKLIIGTKEKTSHTPAKKITEEEVDALGKEADNAYNERSYYVALDIYKQLYEYGFLNAIGIKRYADCNYYTGQIENALELYQDIKTNIESDFSDYKAEVLYKIGSCFDYLGNFDEALQYLEKAKYYSKAFSSYQVDIVMYISRVYQRKEDYDKARKIMDDYIPQYMSTKGLQPTDCWTKYLHDENIAEMYYERSLCNDARSHDEKFLEDLEKYRIIAAAWGSEKARNWCKKYDIRFVSKPDNYNY